MLKASHKLSALKGVGEKRLSCYKKLGVDSILSLLQLFPRYYIDYTQTTPLAECRLGEVVCFVGEVTRKQGATPIRRGLTLFRVFVTDGLQDVKLTIFNSQYQYDQLIVGRSYYVRGKMGGDLTHYEMASPEFVPLDAKSPLKAIYPLTEGLSLPMVTHNIAQALELIRNDWEDLLPDEIRAAESLCDVRFAYENIHFPTDQMALEQAKKRLVFDEFLTLQLALGLLKSTRRQQTGVKITDLDLAAFYRQLPFTLTDGQQGAIQDALQDLLQPVPMNRLLQGDVGCGKTMVACALAFCMAKNGYQTAMMAPTALLAEQHAQTFQTILAPMGISVGLLSGGMTAKQKKELKAQIEAGQCDVVIGTHALIQDSVVFARMGLVVTDEQHRFGVQQRSRLAQKGENPHCLIMSATPIPRTLALMIYGDLELSVIKDSPKGRKPIETYLILPSKQARAFAFLKKQIDAGYQGYLVCPRIEEQDTDSDLHSIQEYLERLKTTVLSTVSIGVLHGKMKADQKEQVMTAFRAGEISLLLSTTVVEVGVDVPNAVVMMIENAERFGLSQLHQLRGRVGRGDVQSYCILVSASHNEKTLERLKIMTQSTDGFYIAEQDLAQRGAGDFFGSRQHGLPELKIANMMDDIRLLEATGVWAKQILQQDPTLETPAYAGLHTLVHHLIASGMHQA